MEVKSLPTVNDFLTSPKHSIFFSMVSFGCHCLAHRQKYTRQAALNGLLFTASMTSQHQICS